MMSVAPARTHEAIAAEIDALDAWESQYSTPARKAERARLEKELHETAHREIVEAQAIAAASAGYVEELETAYQQAFAAVETLVSAVERVQTLRSQEPVWKRGSKLGVAPNRPEPWHVRATRNKELRRLNERFNRVVNGRW